MRAGQLDQRIRFESLVIEQDPALGPQPGAWTEVATVWAEVRDVLPSKAESQVQGIRLGSKPVRVRVRYRVGLTSDMRIVQVDRSGRLLKITSGPAEIGRREAIELMAEEFSTAGDA